MALNLEELKFVVITDDLDAAAKKIKVLGDELAKVNKPTKQAAIDAEKLALAQATVAKKAAEVEEANNKAALSALKLSKAQDGATESSKTHMSVLEKQQSITSYMSEGLSKGMATIMSYGKAAGLAANDLKLLLDTLQTQKKFSGDPFDKSLSGVTSLKNELGILKEVQRLYGAGVELTSKQVRELASDKERLIVKLKEEGASLSTMKSELRSLKSEYVNLATSINKFSDAESQMIKQQKDAAKATAYLADADARLAAALDVSNSKLDKAGSDALVKYGKALQQTGMSSDEAAAKLAHAKTQFDAIADKKQADRLQYLARAISVQMGDVGISLASGMNPLLVMIQQGDQIRGAIQQAGASGKELEKAMGNAAVQIASSFKDTGIAIGGFFVNAVKSASSALLGLPVELTKAAFLGMFASADVSAQAFERLKLAAISFSKVGVVVLITALVTLGKVMYDSLLAERELSVALATTGSKMQMNRAQAIEYARSMADAGKQGSQYVNVITEMAKAGYNAKDNFKLVANSAIDMEKYTGKSIAETVKAFKTLAEDPVEGIAKLAKEYANVSPAVVKLVNELARQGDVAKAAAVATKEMARVNAEAVKAIAADAGYLERIWLDVIENIGKGWQKLKTWVLGWGTEDTLAAQLAAKQKQLAGFNPSDNRQLVTAEKLKIEAEIQGLKDKIKLQKEQKDLQTAQDLKTKGEVEWQALLNKHLSKESEIKKGLAEIEKVGLQAGKDRVDIERMKAEYLAKQNPAKAVTVTASKDLSIIQKDYNEQLKLAEGFAKDERAILKARFDAGLIERADFIAQDTALLTRTEQKQLDVIDSFTGKYRTAYEAQATLLAQAFTKAKDPENKKQLQEQLVNLTKDFEEFNATVADTKVKLSSAFSSREQVALLEYEKAAFASTKTFKEYAKAQEDAAANKRIDLELNNRLSTAYGAEAASIKAVADETKRQTAEVSKFTKAQEEAYKQYQIALNNPNATGTERGAAYTAYVTAMDNANKAIAISKQSITQAGIDAEVQYYKQEQNRVNQEITDALVNSLGKGWKTAGEALRNILIAELKKPITVVVKAMVDFVSSSIGSGLNSMLGGASGSPLTSTLGNMAGSYLLGSNAAYGAAIGTTSVGAGSQAAMLAAQTGEFGAAGLQATASAAGTTSAIATAVPYVAAALLAANALGLFRSTKQVGGGISGTLGEGDINSYATMRKSGTLFRGPSYWRENRGEFSGSDALQASFAQLKASTATMAEAVGVSSDSVKDFTKKIEISFDGLTETQIQEKIATTFKGVGDELAALVLGAGATAEQLSSLYNNIMQQRYDLETQLLELQGDTIALRERERAKIYETNQALFDQIKALEDKKAADEEAAKALEKLTSITTTIVTEINRLRGVNTSQTGLESQFAILTAQARAGDLEALAKLPSITQGLEQIAGATAVNATDIVMARARLAQSLQDTLGYVGADGFSATPSAVSTISLSSVSAMGTGATATVSASSSNQELLSALVTEVQGLRAEVRADVSHNAKTAKILERANQDGETLSVSATIDGGVV